MIPSNEPHRDPGLAAATSSFAQDQSLYPSEKIERPEDETEFGLEDDKEVPTAKLEVPRPQLIDPYKMTKGTFEYAFIPLELRMQCFEARNIELLIGTLSFARLDDCWFRIDGSVQYLLTELYVYVPFGQGVPLLLKTLTDRPWDPAKYFRIYNLLLRNCAGMEDIRGVQLVRTAMSGYEHLFCKETLRFIQKVHKIEYERPNWQKIETRKMSDGSTHEGTFDEKGRLIGFGRVTKTSGEISQGVFRDGLLHGNGIIARGSNYRLLDGHFWRGGVSGGIMHRYDGRVVDLDNS